MSKKNKELKSKPTVKYWHGGSAGRLVGDQLIPGTEVPEYSRVVAEMSPDVFNQQRPDYVHITTDRDMAYDYAISYAKYGPAALYEVKPLGHLEHDPDYPRGVSHRCRSALVISVAPDVITSELVETGAAHGYETWDDGSPLYDDEGFALPAKKHQYFGVKAAHLKSLGIYADFDAINERCVTTVKELRPSLSPEHFAEYQQRAASANAFGL